MANDIPQNILNEIDFILGSIEMCQSDFVKPILQAHGFEGEGWVINPTDDLIRDIYEKLFVTGILVPFEGGETE